MSIPSRMPYPHLKTLIFKLVYLAKQYQISNKYYGAPTDRKIIGWVDDSRDHCALKIKNRGGQPLTSALAFSGHQRNKVKITKLLLFPIALKIGCPPSLTFLEGIPAWLDV